MSDHPGFDIAELARRQAASMVVGTVFEADYAKASVRVRAGDWESGWLPWMTGRAGGNRSWSAPDIGEQVVVLSPGGDPAQGFLLPGSIYQNEHPQNGDSPDVDRLDFGDSISLEFDRASGDVRITASGKITLTASEIHHEKA